MQFPAKLRRFLINLWIMLHDRTGCCSLLCYSWFCNIHDYLNSCHLYLLLSYTDSSYHAMSCLVYQCLSTSPVPTFDLASSYERLFHYIFPVLLYDFLLFGTLPILLIISCIIICCTCYSITYYMNILH